MQNFKKIIFLIGIFLLGINIYGLFKTLRNPEIYAEQNTWFLSDITLKYPEIKNEFVRKDHESDKDFALRVNTDVHYGILHYWDDEGLTKYHLRVPAWENYLLYTASYIDPKKYRKYEFSNYKKNLERGVGLCSIHAMVLKGVLNDNGIDAELWDIRHHVVLRTKVDKNEWWILDSDYGVIVPYDTAAIRANPEIILASYKDMNSLYKPEIKKHYTPEYLAELYGGESNRIYTVDNWFEYFSYWAIWIIPFLLMLPYAMIVTTGIG
jgi:hypothetical protein